MNVEKTAIASAPQWLLDRCGTAKRKPLPAAGAGAAEVNPDAAAERAAHYLKHEAPPSIEGTGGDHTAFKVAAKVKDMGVDEAAALALLLDHWNDRCSPPWAPEELEEKVANAYRYGTEPVGSAAPEAVFTPVSGTAGTPPADDAAGGRLPHPLQRLNEDYAFVIANGGHHILWETSGPEGQFELRHLPEPSFHKQHAAETIQYSADEKPKPLTQEWIRWPDRRSYKGFVFKPEAGDTGDWYNLWRGLAVEPYAAAEEASDADQAALQAFLDHARDNVCRGDEALYSWLMGYFAQLVQNPGECPPVALVFRGRKGVGKNALIERVGALLGNHFMVTSNRRYLVGNFNSHLERLLLFVMDEAFWSGDKQAEGQLKDLITGARHTIELKGQEPYHVANLTRVVIIGNEDWLVPASEDERRYAVFDVGEGRQKDAAFFIAMRKGLEAGGYRLLLRYLLDWDYRGVDLNSAPSTSGLLDQKIESMGPVSRWWMDCLEAGEVLGLDVGSAAWPAGEVATSALQRALEHYCKRNNIRGWQPNSRSFGRSIKQLCPPIRKSRRMDEGDRRYVYQLPGLEVARDAFGAYVGHEIEWEKD